MSIAHKLYLALEAMAVAYFAILLGRRYLRRRAASQTKGESP